MTPDLDSLFESRVDLSKYTSVREELEAVASGIKAMSVFLFPSASIDSHPFYNELRQIASEINLSLVINNKAGIDQDGDLSMAYVFVAGIKEYWRIPAYLSFQLVFDQYGWSDVAEHFESLLLGYADEDIKTWLDAHSASRIGWTGKTFYLFLSSVQAADVRMLGKRSLDPKGIVQPVLTFFNRKLNPVRKDVDSLISEGHVLARVSVREPFFRELFGRQTVPSEFDVITSLLTAELASKMNSALESSFQFLEGGEWR